MTVDLTAFFTSLPCPVPQDLLSASKFPLPREEGIIFLTTARERLVSQIRADADELVARISSIFEHEIHKLKLDKGVGQGVLSLQAEEWLLERGASIVVRAITENPRASAAWNKIGVYFPARLSRIDARGLVMEMASKSRGDDVVSQALRGLFEEANTLSIIELSLEQAAWICSSSRVVEALKEAAITMPREISRDTVLSFMKSIKDKTSIAPGRDRHADLLRKEIGLLLTTKYEEKARAEGTDL